MRYDVILTTEVPSVKIKALPSVGVNFYQATFEKNDKEILDIFYRIERINNNSWIDIRKMQFITNENRGIQNAGLVVDKDLPEDTLEELAALVALHGVRGVRWGTLAEICTYKRSEYPEYHLCYRVMPGMGRIPRVTFHEMKGDYFYLDMDGVTYRSVSLEELDGYIEQRKRLGIDAPIPSPVYDTTPSWVMTRSNDLNYEVATFVD